MLNSEIHSWDERRDLIVCGTEEETIRFAVEHWIHSAKRSIQQRGRFAVALSGGSTPKAIYAALVKEKEMPWGQVFLFWSDERCVPSDHPDSNYRMAMENGFKHLPIPKAQIFRIRTELEPSAAAKNYEEIIHHTLGKDFFDLVMLGMGEDGHTASLFPNTPALQIENELVFAQIVPDKKNPRITLTFPCINQSHHIAIYAIGPKKASMVQAVLDAPILSQYPASRIGTPEHKALWILDHEAAANLSFN
ncbi:MAG: 6-phosphogluconolactonase [Chlamydiae bacterium]|nr:6-phosphogluconolactonase [Chlamydiota bacterium]